MSPLRIKRQPYLRGISKNTRIMTIALDNRLLNLYLINKEDEFRVFCRRYDRRTTNSIDFTQNCTIKGRIQVSTIYTALITRKIKYS